MGAPKGVTPNGTRLRGMREAVAWTQEQLAKKSGLSVRKIQDAEAGKSTGRGTLAHLERTLEDERRRLETGTITVPGNPDDWSPDDLARFLAELRVILGTAREVRIVRVEKGSTKITVVLTPEDARRLEAAFRDGKLKPLGVLKVETDRSRGRARLRDKISLASSILGVLCSAAVFLPVWRVPCFAAGVALGLTGGVFGRRRGSLLALAGLAVVANAARWVTTADAKNRAAIALAKAREAEEAQPDDDGVATTDLVVFYTDGGDELVRAAKVLKDPPPRSSRSLRIVLEPRDVVRRRAEENYEEVMRLSEGLDAALYRSGGKQADQFDQFTRKLNTAYRLDKLVTAETTRSLPLGRRPMTLECYDKLIFSGRVFVPTKTKIFCLVEPLPDGSSRVTFLPDITRDGLFDR